MLKHPPGLKPLHGEQRRTRAKKENLGKTREYGRKTHLNIGPRESENIGMTDRRNGAHVKYMSAPRRRSNSKYDPYIYFQNGCSVF